MGAMFPQRGGAPQPSRPVESWPSVSQMSYSAMDLRTVRTALMKSKTSVVKQGGLGLMGCVEVSALV